MAWQSQQRQAHESKDESTTMFLLVAPAQLRLLGCPLCAMAVTHYPAMLLTHRRDRPSRRALPCGQDDRALAGCDRIGKAHSVVRGLRRRARLWLHSCTTGPRSSRYICVPLVAVESRSGESERGEGLV